jgi:hypothetical protein
MNGGPKFLYNDIKAVSLSQYDRPYMAELWKQSILEDIRMQRIPVDFLDLFHDAKVPFYEGTLPNNFYQLPS